MRPGGKLSDKVKALLRDNPVSSIIDMEDQELIESPIQLDRLEMKDGSIYLELDQRIRLSEPQLDQLFHTDIDTFAS